MPVAYLRIVCAKITSVGKFSVREIFSANGEKNCCANFFAKNSRHPFSSAKEITGKNQAPMMEKR